MHRRDRPLQVHHAVLLSNLVRGGTPLPFLILTTIPTAQAKTSITSTSFSLGLCALPPGSAPSHHTSRELLSEVFLAAPSTSSTASALFVGWGLLVGYDLFLTQENASEPLDIPCNDAAILDVWCPLGAVSDPIPFNRSEAAGDAAGGARSPINHATAFVDLDWMYGRDESAAAALRTLTGGYLNLTDDELPHLLADGTWLVSERSISMWTDDTAIVLVLLTRKKRALLRNGGTEKQSRGRLVGGEAARRSGWGIVLGASSYSRRQARMEVTLARRSFVYYY